VSLNCIEIENVIKYIKIPCIITNFSQLDEFSLVINTTFNNISQKILVSVRDNFNRITTIPEKENIETKDLRFSQFLNANIRYYVIKNVYQINYSRIVIFEIENDSLKLKFIARLWGVAGNILLLDNNNIILECLKRYPKRNEWVNNKFIFPDKNPDLNYSIREIFKNNESNIDNDKVYFYYKDVILNQNFFILKNNLLTILKKDIEKIKNEITNIQKISNEDEEKYLKIGELIKSFSYQIKQGEKKVKLFDYEREKEIEIELDPDLSPIDNAKKYFNKYKKIKDTKIQNAERLSLLNKRLEYLENNHKEVENLTKDNIKKLLEKKEKIIKKINKKENNEKTIGREFILSDSYKAIVSKNAKEAAEILSKVAKGNDYWFHIRDYSGSHVIVKYIKNKELTQKAKLEAAHLAFYYSKAKGDEGDIYFTQVKYLHKPNSKTPGLVIPIKEKNIKLKFDKKIIENIFLNNERI